MFRETDRRLTRSSYDAKPWPVNNEKENMAWEGGSDGPGSPVLRLVDWILKITCAVNRLPNGLRNLAGVASSDHNDGRGAHPDGGMARLRQNDGHG